MFGSRILILIPHPDDEVVGCAAAIARARAQGAQVFEAFLSHGCVPRDALWRFQREGYAARVARRMREAQVAAEFLGITIAGRNDTRPARQIWRELPGVLEEVRAAIGIAAPDRIWVPAFEGGNPDHDAVNALASTLDAVPVFEFSEYHFTGGRPHANEFIDRRGDELILTLSPEERSTKRAALAIYQSERGNLSSLDSAQEQFRPLARYDYARRPHDGRLWYERFQWVPLRHPRVDYTRAEEVTAAIQRFLGR
jgi:LmbE family N-acetylglucosaminyl deacetylase